MDPCPAAAKMDTRSSGKEVEKATSINPMVVLPKPVMSATFTELLIVTSLALARTASEPARTSTLPHIPSSSSNKAMSQPHNQPRFNAKNFPIPESSASSGQCADERINTENASFAY
jgi:hypothetical protein